MWADGYQSLGRALMCRGVDLRYRGYMLWRGLLPKRKADHGDFLGSTVPRLSFPTMPGNLVAYHVPGADGSSQVGERLVNWASYIPLSEGELDSFMIDRSGTPVPYSWRATFIWNPLDLATSDAVSAEAWWRHAVQFPEDFGFEPSTDNEN